MISNRRTPTGGAKRRREEHMISNRRNSDRRCEAPKGGAMVVAQNVTRSAAVYVAGGGTCSRMDRTRESNPPLLPVSGSKTGKSLLTHFQMLCPASVNCADDARRMKRCDTGMLIERSRSLKKLAG